MPRKRIGLIVTVVLSGFAVLAVWLNRYNLYDWSRLYNYHPSEQVAQLATNSDMSSYGTRLFYVNNPQLSDREKFSTECTSSEQTIVLGCYTGTHIYIFDVTDEKLSGVEEVTAAHEMLHAAYQRLSGSEKAKVNALLEDAYARINDPKLTEVIAGYKKTEPGQELNELHSILGTEYANLGPGLEAYYKKYFNDRTKVVTLANAYKKVFQDIEAQVDAYDANLALRKAEINKNQTLLETEAKELAIQKQQMESLLESGQTAAYNAQVSSYNTQVNKYNALIATTRSLIDSYNAVVEKRNALAVQQQGLAQSLDSRLSPINDNN